MRIVQAAGCLLLLATTGCGESGPPTGTVSGKVTIGGAAPPEPVVVQYVNSTMGQGGTAITESDGSYELAAPIRVGEYTVYFERKVESTGAVSTAQEQLSIVPKEYRSEMSSPLKKQVNEGENTIDLEVPKA
jgi:hypothetical protein